MPNSFPSSIAEHKQSLHQTITSRVRLHDYHSADALAPIQTSFSVYKVSGSSNVGDTYAFTVTFVSDEHIPIEELTDTNASLLLKDEDNPLARKEIHGKIFSAKESGSVSRKKLYTIQIVSPLHYLALNTSYTIHQDKNAAEIISELILSYSSLLDLRVDIKVDLQTLAKRETCTQYGQSDLDFIKMLCEEEGLSLLCDASNTHTHTITLCELNEHSQISMTPCECTYNLSKTFTTSAHKENYYEQSRPSVSMRVEKGKQRSSHSMLDNEKTSELRSTLYKEQLRDRLETLDESIYKDLSRYTQLDALRAECESIRIQGTSYALELSDALNTLLVDTKANKKIQAIILSVRYEGYFPNALDEYVTNEEASRPNYEISFTAIPADLIYKPSLSRLSQNKPRISGITTAIVANSEKTPQDYANEIDIDEKGRIRVIFNFDQNRPTSTYIPISNAYSGDAYGTQFIPRVNSEVIVEFINGDIDRPVITGTLHNGENRHPYNLPKERTKSFIKTQTTPQYEDKEGYNELLFEDKQNNELLALRAQNDYRLHVLYNTHTHVGNSEKSIIETDQELTVQNDLNITIGADSRTTITGNSINTIEKDQVTTVKQDQEVNILEDQITIVNENQTTIVEQDLIQRIKGQLTRYVEKEAREKYLQNLFIQVGKDLGIDVKGALELKAGSIKNTGATAELDGADGISLKVGGNVLTVDSSGIHFKTPLYDANSGNGGVSSSAVNIADLIAPTYQKLRVTEITGPKKQSAIDETLTYTVQVEKFENDEWKPATDLEETQKLQLNWHFIKNNEIMDTDIITDNITDDDIDIDGLIMTANIQEDNIQQFGHIHAYFSDPENEGYLNTKLKRNIKVEEIRGHSLVEKNDFLEYDVIFNVDNITDNERKEFEAEVIEVNKDETQKSSKYELDEDLIIKHPLEREKIFKKILIDVAKKGGL
jgi:type VI secretion system secreted protein VgrG